MNLKRLTGLIKIVAFLLILLTATNACATSTSDGSVVESPGSAVDTSQDDQPLIQPPEDRPAQLPPPPPPAAGQAPSLDARSPYVFNHLTPLLAEVYYGPCASQETLVTIQTAFTPVENVDGVYLQYYYRWNEVTFSPYYTVPMSKLGVGDWIGDIDAGLEAAGTLGSSNGQAFYFVAIQDINGQIAYSPGQWLDVKYCSPAANAPSDTSPTSPPTAPSESGPNILYFNYTNPATEGDSIHLEWAVENATCEVTLNGNLVEASGSQDDEVPLGNGGTSWYYILEAYGPPCDDPHYAFEEADVPIEPLEGKVHNQYSATLLTLDRVDFDDPSGPGDAILMAHPENNADGRLYFMQKSGTNTLLAGVSSQPSVADCVSAIDQWASITVWLDEGFFFCFQTDQGHYGYFYRSGMAFDENKNTWEVNIEITTWETP
jgi:hypothetical protein